MQIEKDTVVTFNYTLTDNEGNVLDESQDGTFAYLHGAGNIIPGLERELTGKEAGDNLTVNVAPEDGYGLRNDELEKSVPRSMFDESADIEVGARFQAEANDGRVLAVTVVSVDDENVVVDGNHPLAGVALQFVVEVVDVRPAAQEEIAHGHVHGPGGHQH